MPDAPVKPRIAVFSGPTATIQNSPPLVTGAKGRAAAGLPPLTDAAGDELRFDSLRPQRLAAPVTVYVEHLSAHPLELDAAELYAPPDGWVVDGAFTADRPADGVGTPVVRVELDPSDGLFLLPYVSRQADGSAWEDATAFPLAPAERSRQTFYPDASRIYEEIDRFFVDSAGMGALLSSQARYDFYRPAPSGGWTKGLPAARRTDRGEGDLAPEALGRDFFVYFPRHLRAEPDTTRLALATTMVQRALDTGEYAGGQWLEGSPTTEESMYWLGLLVDTTLPLVGHSAQRPHGTISADGDRNIVDGVEYILSGIWADGSGVDRVGAVMIVDEVVFAAREVTKTDARPGNYQATGGHGGIVATMGGHGAPELTYLPVRKHTSTSDVCIRRIPTEVPGVAADGSGGVRTVTVTVKDADDALSPGAMPSVTIAKYARYQPATGEGADGDEVEIRARIAANLRLHPLAGFVGEGASPYGSMHPSTDRALRRATFSGMPVAKVGRGNTGGLASRADPVFVTGSNLTSTKARMLLMACLLKLGALPPAADPEHPTDDEVAAVTARIAEYQAIFDTH